MVGVAADTPEDLSKLRRELELPYTMLSDPQLACAGALGVPVSSRAGYLGSLALHPEIRHLPRKAFLQPAVLVWRGGELVHEWLQYESLLNLYGARGRPSPEQILQIAQDAAT